MVESSAILLDQKSAILLDQKSVVIQLNSRTEILVITATMVLLTVHPVEALQLRSELVLVKMMAEIVGWLAARKAEAT